MVLEHRARITWSAEQLQSGLPDVIETIDPAWFVAEASPTEGWSLICRFEQRVCEQGNPSAARVRFMMDGAPHERLKPGVVLRLFERGTQKFATVEILS